MTFMLNIKILKIRHLAAIKFNFEDETRSLGEKMKDEKKKIASSFFKILFFYLSFSVYIDGSELRYNGMVYVLFFATGFSI